MKIIETTAAPAAIGPYSQAITAGGLVYTSGQIPIDPATGAIGATGIEGQARQAIRNLAAVLSAAGSGLDRVVKTTCFLTDMDDFAAFNAVYAELFPGKPARSCVEVSRLPRARWLRSRRWRSWGTERPILQNPPRLWYTELNQIFKEDRS